MIDDMEEKLEEIRSHLREERLENRRLRNEILSLRGKIQHIYANDIEHLEDEITRLQGKLSLSNYAKGHLRETIEKHETVIKHMSQELMTLKTKDLHSHIANLEHDNVEQRETMIEIQKMIAKHV